MKLRASCGLVALVALILICGSTYAKDNELQPNSLRGLKGVNVFVNRLPEEVVKDVLTVNTLRTDVELKLRLASIVVLSYEEFVKELRMPYLAITVNSLKSKQDAYIYSIRVELVQGVHLERSPSVKIAAATWRTGGLRRTAELKTIREDIRDRIDDFINAYLSVNPKN